MHHMVFPHPVADYFPVSAQHSNVVNVCDDDLTMYYI